MTDFFVSYNKADLKWAEWIAWQLEEAGHTTRIQAWDFRPGGNFVQEMQKAAATAARTVAVLSPDYLTARFTQPEWQAAFAKDPTGDKGLLLPVRVRECDLDGMLPQVIYIDLVGLDEATARTRLLAGVKRDRAKPETSPPFPGKSSRRRGQAAGSPKAPPPLPAVAQPARTTSLKTTSAARPAVPAGPLTTSGAWVKLGDGFYQSKNVDWAPDGIVVACIRPKTGDEEAALGGLHSHRYGRASQVAFAYGNRAGQMEVKSSVPKSEAGKTIYEVILKPDERRQGGWSSFGSINGVSDDEIAEMRAKLLLLNEQPAGVPKNNVLSIQHWIEGSGPVKVTKGIFPDLWTRFKSNPQTFLARVRLEAVYVLIASDTVKDVLELKIGPVQRDMLPVRFRGRRAQVADNVDPTVIKVEGKCRLGV